MKILFFGDIVGRIGRHALAELLPQYRDDLQPDLIVANGENMAHGQKITPRTMREVLDSGVDIITSGDHHRTTAELDVLAHEYPRQLVRPANYPEGTPGKGALKVKVGKKDVLIVNLQGRVFMKHDLDCPFRTLDRYLSEHPKVKHVIVDFHAEATSEKVAMGWHARGRVSAVLGTHTHVPTADARILPDSGTAHVSDVGMVGARDGVIGVNRDVIVNNFLTQIPEPHDVPEHGMARACGVLVTLNDSTGKAESIERVDREIEI